MKTRDVSRECKGKDQAMTIQILYFEGCPNHLPTVARVKEVVARLGKEVQIEEVEVTSPEDAALQTLLRLSDGVGEWGRYRPACSAAHRLRLQLPHVRWHVRPPL